VWLYLLAREIEHSDLAAREEDSKNKMIEKMRKTYQNTHALLPLLPSVMGPSVSCSP
jgi:hypothetical protein